MRATTLTAVLCALLAATGCRRASPNPAAESDAKPRAATRGGPAASLLGGERGLDHVGIAVKDLDAATHIYHDVLGFNRPTPGRLPNGIQNVNYYFSDSTYLETMIAWDRGKAPWLASFTDRHSGALFAVLSAFSPDSSAEFLAAHGIKASAPYSGTIETAGEDATPPEKWQTFFLPENVLPGDSRSLYFISYSRGPRDEFLRKLEEPRLRRRLYHKNTALGLRAVWFAVTDLEAASKAYASIGLPRGRAFEDAALGAKGQVFDAGAGQIWLLAPKSADGPVAQFLEERGGPGILGVTLVAGSVDTASSVIAERTGTSMPTYDGMLGKSIRVGPAVTFGVWMEFSQQ